jgi:ubiquinone/menaquinone biosynthesis C-methylase UbiE
MSEHEHWQLDGSAPELFERYLVPAITSLWAADLVARMRPGPGEAVLDIACGTGAVARLAAQHADGGRVVGLDFNPGMLAVARAAARAGAPIEWREGSALDLPFADGSFDLVLCQQGLQFFPDRPLALREMKRVMAPSGRLGLSIYSAIERTPAAWAFVQALERRLGPDASTIKRSEHAFAEADQLRALMTGAGLVRVEIHTVTQRITFPSVLTYVRFQLLATPMAVLLANRTETEQEAIIADIAETARSLLAPEMLADGRLRFPQEAFVATAYRAA